MGKGSYFGGSSVLGFGGAFTGSPSNKLTRATDVDAHLSQKEKRDQARKLVTDEKKRPKTTKAADKRAREHYKKADRAVVVEHRRNGEIVATRTVQRS